MDNERVTGPDDYTRDEPEAHRIDRNYAEMLQELRVAQTGVQILFAFLLGIAFQQRFTSVSSFERVLYVITLGCAAGAAVLMIGPVAVHRLLFRQHRKEELVTLTGWLIVGGLILLGLAIGCGMLLVISFVVNVLVGAILTGVLAVLGLTSWWLLPLRYRIRLDPQARPE